jgi:hypothetical protein
MTETMSEARMHEVLKHVGISRRKDRQALLDALVAAGTIKKMELWHDPTRHAVQYIGRESRLLH